MVDETAERIATLGASPTGTAGALVAQRSWEDYELGRADAIEHMAALDVTHAHVMQSHRQAIEQTEETDPGHQDLLITQTRQLELFHWFVRAHFENAHGQLVEPHRRR